MIRPLRPLVALSRDIPWCHLRKPHRPDAVGQILIAFGMLYVLYGFSLTGPRATDRVKDSLVVALAALPLPVWAALWMTAGLLCIGSAFLVGQRPGAVGFLAAFAPTYGWSLWYVAGVIIGAPPRGLVSALIFAFMATVAYRCSRVVDSKHLPRRSVNR